MTADPWRGTLRLAEIRLRGASVALVGAVVVGIGQIDHDSDLTDAAAFLEGFVLAGAAGFAGVVVRLAVMAVRRRMAAR